MILVSGERFGLQNDHGGLFAGCSPEAAYLKIFSSLVLWSQTVMDSDSYGCPRNVTSIYLGVL